MMHISCICFTIHIAYILYICFAIYTAYILYICFTIYIVYILYLCFTIYAVYILYICFAIYNGYILYICFAISWISFISSKPQCCLTFPWIDLEMLLMCCLIHMSVVIMRYFLYLLYLYPCLDLSLFLWYLCDLLFHFHLHFHDD